MGSGMTRSKLAAILGRAAIYFFLIARIAIAAPPDGKPAPQAAKAAAAPFLWKVEGPRPSWLFGTMHSDDAAVATLPPRVTAALDASRSFHPEIALDADLGMAVAAKLFASEGPDLDHVITPALWQRVEKTGAALGLPVPILQRLSPGFAALLFSSPPNTDVSATIDGQLYARAKARQLAIGALETIDEQLSLFQKLSNEAAIAALTDALDEVDAGRPHEKKLVDAYASGDEQALVKIVQEEFDRTPADQALADPLLYNRNRIMAERLLPHLESGSAFVAIGAAHLTGPHSVIALLQARGWKITRVAAP
jgi:uncharacterized protein